MTAGVLLLGLLLGPTYEQLIPLLGVTQTQQTANILKFSGQAAHVLCKFHAGLHGATGSPLGEFERGADYRGLSCDHYAAAVAHVARGNPQAWVCWLRDPCGEAR